MFLTERDGVCLCERGKGDCQRLWILRIFYLLRPILSQAISSMEWGLFFKDQNCLKSRIFSAANSSIVPPTTLTLPHPKKSVYLQTIFFKNIFPLSNNFWHVLPLCKHLRWCITGDTQLHIKMPRDRACRHCKKKKKSCLRAKHSEFRFCCYIF